MLFFLFISVICFSLLIVSFRYFFVKMAYCRSTARMTGKVVIVTGGNSGIGRCTATELARRGAKIYIASEVPISVGETAAKEIQQETGNEAVYFRKLDLGSLKAVQEFSQGILELESEIHLLINNAGVMLYNRQTTVDGFDATITINYVGHFLLTLLLLDRLKTSSPSRILFTTSFLHNFDYLDFDDMMLTKHQYLLDYVRVYSKSKLADLMFARELGKRLEGSGVTVCAVNPGAVDTAIVTQTFPFWAKIMLYTVKKLFFVTPIEGAQTAIHCAVSEQVEGVSGYYFSCSKKTPSAYSMNDEQCAKLWNYTSELIKPYLKETE